MTDWLVVVYALLWRKALRRRWPVSRLERHRIESDRAFAIIKALYG